MRPAFARAGELLSTFGRQAVPLGGLFGRDWQAVTAIAIYWVESLLLALATVALCELLKRRTSELAAYRARRAGADEAARLIDAEREALRKAFVKPEDVATFHLGSLMVFGFFFAMVFYMMISGHMIEEQFVWSEVRDGTIGMLIAVGLGFAVDLWRFPSMPVAAVEARVNACFARWGLFWAVGFFGTAAMLYTGRATLFLGLFAGLKLTWDVWGTLARTFGWRSVKDRESAPQSST